MCAELGIDHGSEKARILRHVETVRNFVDAFVVELLKRGREHDRSKLEPEEFATYVRVQPLLRATEYGSQEYKDACRELGPALKHHQVVNRHHPEFHEGGVNGMTLIDLIEMVCDWKASSLRGGDPEAIMKSIEICSKRFGIEPQLRSVLENTATWMNEQAVSHAAMES